MTQLWVAGLPIKVWVNAEDAPQQLVWNETVHPVRAVVKHWRIDRGWWRLRIRRDYFKLETTTGLLVDVYQDLMTNRWYLQRWYD